MGASPTTDWTVAARAALARILESPQFKSSKRCSAFLRHVIEQAADGRLDALKERTIGVEVFDRDPNYDTNTDPVVRSTAGEVRKRLAQYYTGPGHDDLARIVLPTGGYIPEVRIETVPVKEAPPAAVPAPASKRRRLWIAAVCLLVPALAAAAFFFTRPSALDHFWSPMLAPAQPLLVCIGQPHVYKFDGQVQDRMNAFFDKTGPTPAPVFPSDIVPLWDRYLALGDIQAFTHVSGYLGRAGKQIEMRGVRSVALADLRGRPVLLIGAFNNDWTLSFANDLRYYFEHDAATGLAFVRDRQNPSNRQWSTELLAEHRRMAADFALATRVFNPQTEQYVVIAAGISEIGTVAASEFLSTPEYFAQALKDAPPDWRKKNMQVVLSAKVMSGTAGPPQVLAVHFW